MSVQMKTEILILKYWWTLETMEKLNYWISKEEYELSPKPYSESVLVWQP